MKWKLLGFGIICLILLGACGNSSSGVKIDSVTLARDDGSGKPGETVTLDVIRDGEHRTLRVVLARRPGS